MSIHSLYIKLSIMSRGERASHRSIIPILHHQCVKSCIKILLNLFKVSLFVWILYIKSLLVEKPYHIYQSIT